MGRYIYRDFRNEEYIKELDNFIIRAKQLLVEALLIKAVVQIRRRNMDKAMHVVQKAKRIVGRYDLGLIGPLFLEAMILM